MPVLVGLWKEVSFFLQDAQGRLGSSYLQWPCVREMRLRTHSYPAFLLWCSQVQEGSTVKEHLFPQGYTEAALVVES